MLKDAVVVRIADDSSWSEQRTVTMRIQSQVGVEKAGILDLPYVVDSDKASFVYARVHKPDGSVVDTPVDGAQDQPAPVTRVAPMYSDIHMLQLPVKGLRPGDTLEWQALIRHLHPLVPNQFFYAYSFAKDDVVEQETIELRTPSARYLKVNSATVQPEVTTEGAERVYRWSGSHALAPKDEEKEKDLGLPGRGASPDITVTTFHSWQEVGDWYGALQTPQAQVGPGIQSKANELTRGLSTDAQKITAIYNFVSTQVRYISLSFGIGHYQPHTAAEVLANQYGDCKDKHTLLQSLLKAAGYTAWPALINSSMAVNPDLPSPGQFDHLITVIAAHPGSSGMGEAVDFSKDTFADATPEIAPVGTIMPQLRDKQALVIRGVGQSELVRTPPASPYASKYEFTAKGSLDAKGTLHATMVLDTRGDAEVILRAAFHHTSRSDWNRLVQLISATLSFGGDVSDIEVSDPSNTTNPLHIKYSYERKGYGDWEKGRIGFPLPPFQLPDLNNDESPKGDIYLGAPGEVHYHSELQLPAGYTAELLQDLHYRMKGAAYQSNYTLQDGKLIADRQFINQAVTLPNSLWKHYHMVLRDMAGDTWRMMEVKKADAAKNTKEQAAKPKADEQESLEVQYAMGFMRRMDFKFAENSLKKAQKQDPEQKGLWAAYAMLEELQDHPDKAREDYLHEIQLHPNSEFARKVAQNYVEIDHPETAIDILRAEIKADAKDRHSEIMLGDVLLLKSAAADAPESKEALGIAQKLIALDPASGDATALLGAAQLRAGSKDAGNANLQKSLFMEADSDSIYSASNLLADAKVGLSSLRSSAEFRVNTLETKTSGVAIDKITKADVHRMSDLAQAWETLGWVYAQSGDASRARRFLEAAWSLAQMPSTAGRLIQLEEMEGRKEQAAHMQQLATAIRHAAMSKEAQRRRLTALHATDTREPDASIDTELKRFRSFELKNYAHEPGTADFWIRYTKGKSPSVRFIRGAASLKDASSVLATTDLTSLFPDDGVEVIVRRGILDCPAGGACHFLFFLPEETIASE